ncbi:putative LysR-family transcriptional regulator [Halobacteriovorax marinus SJ]|uniref:LysR-family transcriptional regulator n=1 Tax=Halobacteriovorax marinus (strain ATCC BAA-682 / DSM 15412 / SJ) TaxID=862908 RepID=E1WY43_HALMS|nr:LysR family transcriptional regulator [Halobacteriovorax marinus]CBW27598.1 putative LysR-family transcriptional regulator [Halobacteriovorax marinus SJ]
MIKPEVLSIYVKLCETLSFSKTAEALNIPRSTVSDSIKRLEEDLGTELLKRTTRKVSVTDEGHLLYEKAQNVLSDLIDLESSFTGISSTVEGRVRVDMATILAERVIIPRLPEFSLQYPEIKLEIGSSDRDLDLVAEGIDFVIRAGKLKDSSLIAKRIGKHKIVNCVSRSYADTYGIPRSLDSLHKHYQVCYLQNFGSGKDGFEYLDGSRVKMIKMKTFATVNNTVSYQAACLAGLGIIQVPEIGILKYLESGEMIQVLKKYEMPPMNVYLLYTNRERIPSRVKVFMNWCEEILKEYLA